MIINSPAWKKIKLEDAPLEIIDGDRGNNYPKSDEFSDSGYCLFLSTSNVTVDGFSFVKCSFVSKERDEALRKGRLKRDDIILTTRGTVGNAAWFSDGVPYSVVRINSGMVILRTHPNELLPEFLCCFINSSEFKSQVSTFISGSAQPQLPIRVLKEIKIPLPPIDRQKRIAAILDKAEELRRLRRQSIEHLDVLSQSIFIEMFGDPITNPKGWLITRLSEVSNRITDGTHQPPKWSEDGIPFLFISNIINDKIDFNTKKFISEETYIELTKRCPIELGDIVYTTVGSYGNVAVVATTKKFAFQRHIAHIKPKKIKINSVFMMSMLQSNYVRRQVDIVARGVAQKTVNLADLKNLIVFVPPLAIQQEFAQRIEAIESLKAKHRESLTHLDTLFASLQHRAFRGEL